MGISEVTAAFATWMMIFHRDKNVLAIATKISTAVNIVRKVRTAVKKLPRWLVPTKMVIDNRTSIEFDNGSQIKSVASSADAGRSEAVSLLVVDEAAFVKNMDELWTGLMPTVQTGGRVIVLSTPNGVGNVFHKVYADADAGRNDFHPTKIIWWEHPEHVENLRDDPTRLGLKVSDWYLREIRASNMSKREVSQELECDFLSSGITVIDGVALQAISSTVVQPVSREHDDRCLFVWSPPVQGRKYFISVDVARGDGHDNSAFHVWDIDLVEQVAEYAGQLPPDVLADLVCNVGQRYNNALLVVENNNVGLVCLDHIKINVYPNVYHSRRGDMRPGEAVNSMFGSADGDLIPGFTTSPKTRPLMIAKFEEYVRNRLLTVHSSRLIDELRTFVWNNSRAEAQRGRHDDLVMSAALGIWVYDTFLVTTTAGVDMRMKMLENISLQRTQNTDIHGACKDPRLVPRATMGTFARMENPYVGRLPNGVIFDMRWVLKD